MGASAMGDAKRDIPILNQRQRCGFCYHIKLAEQQVLQKLSCTANANAVRLYHWAHHSADDLRD